jgi:hypothetical protein
MAVTLLPDAVYSGSLSMKFDAQEPWTLLPFVVRD